MYNMNSPIVNNMMGGMYGNSYIPANPISNVVAIGGQGYNNMGGYYNNMYNGYYNPYIAAQQEELRKAQMREQARQETGIWKKMSKSVNKALHTEVTDEYIDTLYQMHDPFKQPTEEELQYQKLVNVHVNGLPIDPTTVQFINLHNMMYDKAKQQFPDDISMYDFQQQMSGLYIEMLQENERQRQKDVSKLYNSTQYNELVNMHAKSNTYFNNIYKGTQETSIDDMEVHLPHHLQNEFQDRKAKFLAAIMNK